MSRTLIAVLVLAAVASCGRGEQKNAALADSLNRDLQLAPVDSSAALSDRPAAPPPSPTPAQPSPAPAKPVSSTPKPAPKPAAAAPTPAKAPVVLTLGAGTEIHATANDSIHSRRNKAGESMMVTVASDIRDKNGKVVIPTGAVITLAIDVLEPAKSKSQKDGKISLRPTQVAFNGGSYPLSGTVDSVEHSLQGQGVTAGGAARVGAGAAAGAVAGRIIGGKKGTIIGGVVGAAAGTAVAVETADRDVVIAPGNAVVVHLTEPLTIQE